MTQPYAVRVSCGFGGSMDEMPMMLLLSVPTMVWGGNVRLIGRGLGLEIDEITGNTTAANRLLGAISWLTQQKPGIYDGLDVPLRQDRTSAVEAQRWAD